MIKLTLFLLALLTVTSRAMAIDDAAPTSRPTRAADVLRVMTYNIHHGEGADRKIDLERLAEIIRREDPDVVALQEVDVKTRRVNGKDLATELGQLTQREFSFGKSIDFAGGQYGNAILTRLPQTNVETHELPNPDRREPRCALSVTIEWNHHPLTIINTHLDHLRGGTTRAAQGKSIAEIAQKSAHPVIVLGDLNATAKDEVMSELFKSFTDTSAADPAPTEPADKPEAKIDWILTNPAATQSLKPIATRVLEEKVASDHRPLVVDLQWIEEKK